MTQKEHDIFFRGFAFGAFIVAIISIVIFGVMKVFHLI